jgi:hypothetical protein
LFGFPHNGEVFVGKTNLGGIEGAQVRLGERAEELFMAKLGVSCGHVDPERKMPGGVRLGDVRVIFLCHVIFLF